MNNILIIEDDENTLYALTKYFERKKYSVKAASTVQEVLNIIEEFTPDVVISDWMLQEELDGVDLVKIISKKFNSIKIIFVTGHSLDEIKKKVGDMNICKFISKPFELNTIYTAVKDLI